MRRWMASYEPVWRLQAERLVAYWGTRYQEWVDGKITAEEVLLALTPVVTSMKIELGMWERD